ncbi:PREDICTED: protein FAM73A isoform X4 [Ceratotherium simum simum]|uniref:Protein FAM73A isoform X4 n=1 Tax=Ceratotherium simum simum TaxID=73337 RepID=A0ABM1CW44_CERSS|nr:PREDICTED: protein FAM73A isoform X4 [Ceratotherium simum simum]
MSEETVSKSQFSLKTAALRVFDLPLSWYYSLSQIKFSPVAKKLFVVTAVSAVSVIFLAHHFKRRRGKKKGKVLPWEPEHLILEYTKRAASDKGSSCSSSRQNLTLSLSSAKEKGSQSCNYANGGLFSKLSGSAQSLTSVQSVNSCHSCACGNSNSWDKADEDDIKLVNIPVTTPENLYLMGMELFEEALRRWEQALTFRNRQAEDEACGSIKLGAGDAIAEESVDDIISTEFIHKLEALLQRAYRLQEEFEATLGASDPNSLGNDIDKDTDITMKGNVDDFGLRDTLSIASTDSFASAAENPKKFEDVFDEMIYFLEQTDHWDSTEMELAAKGVKNLNFYDVVLDFILMDSFEDLENPPTSIQNVVNNRWLNSSFKETAVASSCWSVLKQKRQQMKIPDGFFAHFYAICEHVSPVLAWGFLGPRNSLYDLCCFFKNQVLFFLKDIFDFEKVRYSSIETLAEDLTHLLIRRTELLMAYLGADALRHTSSCVSGHGHVVSGGLLEAKVQ